MKPILRLRSELLIQYINSYFFIGCSANNMTYIAAVSLPCCMTITKPFEQGTGVQHAMPHRPYHIASTTVLISICHVFTKRSARFFVTVRSTLGDAQRNQASLRSAI